MANPDYLTVDSLTPREHKRIFSKISVDPNSGCWNWIGALNSHGYGCVSYKGHQEMTHRVLYALKNGPIPRGFGAGVPVLDHIACDNRRCCNPDHLRLVSNAENLARTGSISAVNRRKTHCKHGHKLPNKPNRPSGYGRYCPVCRSENSRKAYQIRKYGPMREHDLAVKREWARKQKETRHK